MTNLNTFKRARGFILVACRLSRFHKIDDQINDGSCLKSDRRRADPDNFDKTGDGVWHDSNHPAVARFQPDLIIRHQPGKLATATARLDQSERQCGFSRTRTSADHHPF